MAENKPLSELLIKILGKNKNGKKQMASIISRELQ